MKEGKQNELKTKATKKNKASGKEGKLKKLKVKATLKEDKSEDPSETEPS